MTMTSTPVNDRGIQSVIRDDLDAVLRTPSVVLDGLGRRDHSVYIVQWTMLLADRRVWGTAVLDYGVGKRLPDLIDLNITDRQSLSDGDFIRLANQ